MNRPARHNSPTFHPRRRRRARAGLPIAALLAALNGPRARAGDFADAVVNYTPAPGQFINSPAYNDPARALGPPVGGGTASPDNTKLVSLGGFGGSITLRFTPPLEDDPANPFGLDAIVFGNASWVASNPNRRFAEAGVIEVSADDNANGLADDAWYLIPGSHLPSPGTALQGQAWDNNASTPTPPANTAWYPGASFPGWPASYVTTAFRLPALFESAVLTNPLGTSATFEGARGYADCTPTLVLGDTDADNTPDAPLTSGEFYTAPDNPFAVGITPGSGGGDAFDLAHAVDPLTGAPAHLRRADFVRVSTAVNFIAGALGELSTEVGAVARVRPRPGFFDIDADTRCDTEDLYAWHAQPALRRDLSGEGLVEDADLDMLTRCARRSESADATIGGAR